MTCQFFLSDRAVYFLVWNIRLGHEHAGLDFWLNSISVHAPKAPIFIIGTHLDQVGYHTKTNFLKHTVGDSLPIIIAHSKLPLKIISEDLSSTKMLVSVTMVER